MKFRNYCLVIIGDTSGVLAEIEKVSETTPNILDGKGLIIATFSSAVSPSELNQWFKLNKRNFLVFDLNTNNSGFNINKKDIHEGLFGFLNKTNLEDKSDDLLREILLTSDTRSDRIFVKPIIDAETIEVIITEKDIEKMSKYEREELFNKIIDNGVDKMSENDKKVLNFLSKY